MLDRGSGLRPLDTQLCFSFFPVATLSSTIVFQAPQAGHLPIHLGLSFPHSVQNHFVFVFAPVAIGCLFYASTKISKKSRKKNAFPPALGFCVAAYLLMAAESFSQRASMPSKSSLRTPL